MKGKMGMKEMACEGCSCKCHMVCTCVKPVGLLLVGLLFAAKNWGWMNASLADKLWPLVLVLAGAFMLAKKMCKCC